MVNVLVYTALIEEDLSCRESQLHALNELAEEGLVDRADISPLWYIDGESLCGSEVEYRHTCGKSSGENRFLLAAVVTPDGTRWRYWCDPLGRCYSAPKRPATPAWAP